MIKKIKGSLFIKVFITTAILLTGVSFLVYLILAWYTPKTYSNTLNATLDEQTKIFISEISQMPMEETGGIFDNFLDYQNVDRMELFEENGNRINLPTERSADNDVVIETKAWGNEDNNAPIISNSYTVSFLGKNTNYTLVVYGAAGQVAELQRAFQKVFPLLAFIVFCVSLVTGWIFSHLITKPVLKISRISKEMSELQFEWQLDEQRTDELGILAKSLNYLSQKLNVTLNDLQAANRKVFVSDARHEMAYQRRLSRHKAQYSLDCDDGIEYSACLHEPTPQELLERMELFIRLWNALNSLPEIQGRRIDAHIILGKSIKEIAEAEGVHEESVRQSIKRGLERMKKTF